MIAKCDICKEFRSEYVEWDCEGTYSIDHRCSYGINHNEYNNKKECPFFKEDKNESRG